MSEQSLEQHQARLAPHFKAGFLQRGLTTFQFNFESEAPFYLTVTENDFSFTHGVVDQPTLGLWIRDHATCWGLLDGSVDGMKAFMDGDYTADGNIVLSQLLLYLFKNTDPEIRFIVQY